MKFVHIADMHFDMPFTLLSKNDLAEERRIDQRKVFQKMINYIKENDIEYLFIAGDLYENEYVIKSTIEYINKFFKQKKDTKIYIKQKNKDQYIRMEETLKRAIVMAEKTADQIKLTTYQERDIILNDAKKNANRIVNESLMKSEQIQRQADNLRRNIIVFKKRIRDVVETQLQVIDDIEKIELDD